jgi:Peptidase_C39 like family
MAAEVSADRVKRIAGLELNALRRLELLGPEFEGARIRSAGTPIFDLNGELLFHRVPVSRGASRIGYADLAVNPALGGPLLAVSHGLDWNQRQLRAAGIEAAKKRKRNLGYDRVRFVAYSYPKIALQFLKGGREVLMLELVTWAVVPSARNKDRKPLEPENFERWSLLDELPNERKKKGSSEHGKRMKVHETGRLKRMDLSVISAKTLDWATIKLVDTRELHFSKAQSDHHVCYEVRGQQTDVWCVGASVEMLLDFYRYNYTQVRLAQELGLGTLANPNGLPYARVGDVVTVIENLSSHALDATMVVNPGFGTFETQIQANRPLISFIPGHSRTVTGYTHSLLVLPGQLPFRGLLVYDPWPPNVGVVTRWENFDTQIYQYAYSAVVTLV